MSLSSNRTPIQSFHGFRIGPLPHSCPALSPGAVRKPGFPACFSFSSAPPGWQCPAPGLSGSAHQLPLGNCSWENPSHSPETGHGNSRDKAALPGPSTAFIQIPGGGAGKPKSLVGSWLCHRLAGALGHHLTRLSLFFISRKGGACDDPVGFGDT